MSLLTSQFEEMYSSMVAGSVPLHSGDIERSVVYMAMDVLNTSAIFALVHEHKETKRAYYFAVPSSSLHSIMHPKTPLAAAVPGHPNHQGNGIYIHQHDPLIAAAIFQDGDLRLLVNSADVLNDYIEELELPVFDVSEGEAWHLVSDKARLRAMADKVSTAVTKYSIISIAISATSLALMFGAAGLTKKNADNALLKQEGELQVAVQSAILSSPLASQISRVQDLAAVSLRSGGWMGEYQSKAGMPEYSVINLPTSVNEETLTTLSAKGKVTTSEDGWIQIVTGSTNAASKISALSLKEPANANALPDAAQKTEAKGWFDSTIDTIVGWYNKAKTTVLGWFGK